MLLPRIDHPTETVPMPDALGDLKDHILIAPLSVWLDVLRRTDPDDHLDLIRWMISQPECDLTLAQFAFYRCRPRLALRQIEGSSPALAALASLCAEIVERQQAGQYPERQINLRIGELTQKIMVLTTVVRTLSKGDAAFDVPAAFLEDVEGAACEVEDVWSSDEAADIHALYENAGLSVTQQARRAPAKEPDAQPDSSVLLAFTDMLLRPRVQTAG